jgi:gamma-D-glutamyl-L-lysine dipeptidyl-peptidase
MNKAICIYTYIPIRKDPSESSEMVSQILYGETFSIIEKNQNWHYIELDFDGYKGWIDYKLSYLIDDQKIAWLNKINPSIVNMPVCIARQNNNNSLFYILAGSNLYDLKGNTFLLFDKSFQLQEPLQSYKQHTTQNVIERTAKQFLNAPYLWGGRSTFGIDCSGFVQTVFKVAGKNLPRDTNQQAKSGIAINSLSESLPGDVAFFENEHSEIVHTGILLSKNEIIHSSGSVHISPIDEKGIINPERQDYTHKLAVIKRIV